MKTLLRIALLTVLFTTPFAVAQTTVTLPPATAIVGAPYSVQLTAAPVAGYNITFNGAQVQTDDGLTYNALTGVLAGTPTAPGVFNVQLQQDSPTPNVFNTFKLALTVSATAPVVTPPVITPPPAATCTGAAPCVSVTCTGAAASTMAYVYVAVFVQSGTGVPTNTAATIIPCTATTATPAVKPTPAKQ
jgi:hypothetical protein